MTTFCPTFPYVSVLYIQFLLYPLQCRYFLAFPSLLGQSVNYNGEESVGGVELEEVHRVVERVGGPVGVDGEEELAREAGHVLVEGVLHEDGQPAVEPVAVNQERPLEVHELKRACGLKLDIKTRMEM